MVDGTVYRAKSDGSVEIAPDDETIPFSNVTFFDADEKENISSVSDIAALKALQYSATTVPSMSSQLNSR